VSLTPPTTPRPLCECGCGLPVKSHTNGVWSRWLPGHNKGRGTSIRNLERKRRRTTQ
jgi:hypothetical protein